MENIIQSLQGLSYTEITVAAVAFVVAFEKLAKLTPTETDNKIVGWAYKLFSILGIAVKDNQGTKKDNA